MRRGHDADRGATGCGSRGRRSGGGDVAERFCRCHLPLDPPQEQHWWPTDEPEPDTTVHAVAMAGSHPWFLRSERREDGWHTAGCGAAHPDSTPARGWGDVGSCWAGIHHAVVDVSAWLSAARAPNQTARRPTDPWTGLPGVGLTVPVIVRRPNDRARH